MRFLFFFFLFIDWCGANTLVITDVDNTIRRSGEGSLRKGLLKTLSKQDKPYPVVKALFQSLYLHQRAEFFYLSLSLEEITPIQGWLASNEFPPGTISQRTMDSEADSKIFKKNQLKEFLQGRDLKSTKVLFWGDNLEVDHEVYQEIAREMGLVDYTIYIRDVTSHDTYWGMDLFITPNESIKFFLQDKDLYDLGRYPEFIGLLDYVLQPLVAHHDFDREIFLDLRDKLALKLYYAYCLRDRTIKCKEFVRKRTLEVLEQRGIRKL